MQAQQAHQGWTSYAVTIGILLIVMVLRLRRAGQLRPLKLGTLWLVPAIYFVVAALMFVQLPPTRWVAIASLAGLGIGAAFGWQRGKMMEISVDPESHALNQKASPAAMMFLVVLIVVRLAVRGVVGESSGVSPAMLTDPLIAFALGMFTLQRVEMYLRARRLIAGVRGRS
jgi:membrane protein CcdC involved in cytochrome C biogenesis